MCYGVSVGFTKDYYNLQYCWSAAEKQESIGRKYINEKHFTIRFHPVIWVSKSIAEESNA